MSTNDRNLSTSTSQSTEVIQQNTREGSDPTLTEVLALEAT
jgi:hypothetical protein